MSDAQRLDSALRTYRDLLHSQEIRASQLANQAVDAIAAGDGAAALEACDAALRAGLDLPEVHYNRAGALALLGRHGDAVAAFDAAAARGLDSADLHQNRGIALFHLGLLDLAVQTFTRALVLANATQRPLVLNSRGFALQDLGRAAEAKADFEAALALSPDDAIAGLNLGLACLAQGEWTRGWQLYEHRWKGSSETYRHGLSRPAAVRRQWAGEHAPDSSLLVLPEQGFGDVLQFVRLLPLVATRFARVGLTSPTPLLRLLRQSLPATIEVLPELPQDGWDWQCPLLSLPLALGLQAPAPLPGPYLHLHPTWTHRWRPRVEVLPGLKVGLAWAGRAEHRSDARRSIPLETFAPLLQLPGISWVSLQKGAREDQLQLVRGAGMTDWTGDFEDFADTAAVVAQLDLVISIDSAVVHLAGALRKPVWMLSRHEGEWRWRPGREDSPWYPGLRIFSQQAPGDWHGVMARVASALRRHLDDCA